MLVRRCSDESSFEQTVFRKGNLEITKQANAAAGAMTMTVTMAFVTVST